MMAALRAEFRAGLPARLAAIDDFWTVIAGGGYPADQMEGLIRAVHTLAGSAATFGEDAVGEAAAAAELRLEACRGAAQGPDAAALGEIATLLDALRRAAAAGQ